ncbi:PDDEXK nuclease domain-containing protein [Arundinibacter roseus]|uniref:DUF1016 family protein n=1 Tax=Arundinibacter roseus TaxID=2070510 RepID=A0A4V2XAB9_9BACT|nr:PDDEXK nuclease domain-containing protein [Arundinibacter roseus]TDB67025.1 DUF1016 family protein [Arundinibacter roseus]
MNELIKSKQLTNRISVLIQSAKSGVLRTINTTMLQLYWQIGKTIQEELIRTDRAEYGKRIVTTVSSELVSAYGRGYGDRNLWRIDSMLFERTALSKKGEDTIYNDLEKLRNEKEMTVELFLKDPYMLDFLGLNQIYNEHELESAILVELQQFILEFGNDFAFLARQKRITIDQEDYYIDLLFYHRKLKRLVAIELKLGKFKAEYKGQLELYLRWLDKYERQEGENQPIGLLLCSEKSDKMIELLELDKSGIHVATYLTEMLPIEQFKQKLLQSVVVAQQQLGTKGNDTEN